MREGVRNIYIHCNGPSVFLICKALHTFAGQPLQPRLLRSRCDIVQLISTHTSVPKITGRGDGLHGGAIIGADIWILTTSL